MGQPPQRGARVRVVGQLYHTGEPLVPKQSMDFQLLPGRELRLTFRFEEPVSGDSSASSSVNKDTAVSKQTEGDSSGMQKATHKDGRAV